jgi:hypothetical protein
VTAANEHRYDTNILGTVAQRVKYVRLQSGLAT